MVRRRLGLLVRCRGWVVESRDGQDAPFQFSGADVDFVLDPGGDGHPSNKA